MEKRDSLSWQSCTFHAWTDTEKSSRSVRFVRKGIKTPLVFYRLFFFLHHKMDKLRNSTQWSIGPSTPWLTNCDQMRVKVFTCWSRVLSWWWFFWFTISWNFILQTLKILKDAYTSRIVRVLSRERLKAMKALYALYAMYALYALYAKYANVLVEKRTLVEKSKIWNLKPNCIYSM